MTTPNDELIRDLQSLADARRKDHSFYDANLLDRAIAALSQDAAIQQEPIGWACYWNDGDLCSLTPNKRDAEAFLIMAMNEVDTPKIVAPTFKETITNKDYKSMLESTILKFPKFGHILFKRALL